MYFEHVASLHSSPNTPSHTRAERAGIQVKRTNNSRIPAALSEHCRGFREATFRDRIHLPPRFGQYGGQLPK